MGGSSGNLAGSSGGGGAGGGGECDADHDGHRNALLPECMGEAWDDCDDSNPDVHPGQSAYFATPYKSPSGKTSFDYDCDGHSSVENSSHAACGWGSSCSIKTPGFVGFVPWCGQAAQWADTCMDGQFSMCNPVSSGDVTQRCR